MSLVPVSQYWLDGKSLTDPWISLAVDSPLLQAGEGWFETLRIESGAPLRYAAHVNRLCCAWDASDHLEPKKRPEDDHRQDGRRREWLQARIAPALREARRYATGRLRIIVIPSPASRHSAHPAVQATAFGKATVLVELSPYDPPQNAYRYGVTAITSHLPHPRTGELGKSLSYHWSRWVQREAQAQGAEIALLAARTAAGTGEPAAEVGWLEASTASLFWPSDQGWRTTSGMTGALSSVTVQGLCESGLAVQARPAALPQEIFENGLLLVSALRLVVAVRSIDGRNLPDLTDVAAALRTRLLTNHG